MCQYRAVERALRRVSRNLGFKRPRMRDHTLGEDQRAIGTPFVG